MSRLALVEPAKRRPRANGVRWSFDLLVNGDVVDTLEGDFVPWEYGVNYFGFLRVIAAKRTRYALHPGDVITIRCTAAPPTRHEGGSDPWTLGHIRIRVKGGGVIGP